MHSPAAPPTPHRTVRRSTGRRRVALAAGLGVIMVGGTVVAATVASAADSVNPDTAATYTLVSHSSGKAMDIARWSSADDGDVVQWPRTGGANQQFRFVAADSGYYRVRSVSSGKVLDDKAWGTAEGTPVVQYTDHDSANQQWRIAVSGSAIRLINRHSGKALDVTGTADGGTVGQHTDRDDVNQQWTLVQVGGAPTTPTTQPPPTTQPTPPPAPSSLPLWVNPDNPAARQVATWQSEGDTADARKLATIAGQPMASWVVGGSAAQATASVDGTADRAQAAHAEAVFVAYNIPGRDCGSYSAGGSGSQSQYHEWVAGFAAGLAGRQAIVILEPDAVPQQMGGCTAGTTRYAELADAVSVLESAGADVYVDAGHPGWISDIDQLAAALTSAGVRHAAGFSLNVANFTPTAQDIAYGEQISAKLGGAHFVIDTSRDGVNPPAVTSGPSWCNPPGAKIGPTPTRNTGNAHVDAYLWIKTPGESDGNCRPGEASAGGWMPQYALALVS